MKTIDVFYHGKLRDTVSLCGNLDAPPAFVENIKKKVFESSSEYARMSAKPMMIVELRRWLEDMYSVFTYFVPAKDTLGRSGGFVAVTAIIHGALPKERVKLYELFATVHQKLIELGILSKSQNVEADSFDKVKDNLEALAKYFSEAISEQCGIMEDISRLTLNKQEENARQFNLFDINGEDFVVSLADAGKAYISTEFPTLASIKAKKEAEKVKAEKEKKEKENQLIRNLEGQVSDLTAEKEKLTQQVKLLSEGRKQLIEDNEKLRKKIGNKVDQGIKALENSSDIVEDARKKASNSDKVWLRIGAVLPLINFLLLCALFFFVRINLKEVKSSFEGSKKNTPQQEVKPGTALTPIPIDTIQVAGKLSIEESAQTTENDPNPQAQAALDKLGDLTRSLSEARTNSTVENPKFGKTYDARITIKCNRVLIKKGDFVSVGDTLSFTVQEPKEGHVFFVSGARFIDKNNTKAIVDGSSEDVKVWYCHQDDENEKFTLQCNSRKYQLKKSE